jgi:hypothetical protein
MLEGAGGELVVHPHALTAGLEEEAGVAPGPVVGEVGAEGEGAGYVVRGGGPEKRAEEAGVAEGTRLFGPGDDEFVLLRHKPSVRARAFSSYEWG